MFAARLRCMDTKQWHVYPTLHTADVVSETWGGLPTDKQPKTGDTSNQVVGIDKLTAAIRNMLDGDIPLTTAHHAHTPEIVLTSPTTATGIWAMEDLLFFPDGNRLHGAGHYHETYEKRDDRWLITSLHLSRTLLRFSGPAE